MRSSSSQWSFSNMASPLVSFKSAQERVGSHRSYPPHFPQRTSPEGGNQYPITSHHWHQNDLPPINHHSSDSRVFRQTSQTMYSTGNASNLVTSTVAAASGPIVGSTDIRSSPSISTGPCQLTIFYNGSVCVYDHVSPEKAQAIMLLAGNGESTKPISPPRALPSTPKLQLPVSIPPPANPAIVTLPPITRLSAVGAAVPNQVPGLRLPTKNTCIVNQASALRVQTNHTSTLANEPTSTMLLGKDSPVSNQGGRFSSYAMSPPISQSPVVASTSGSEGNSFNPVPASVQANYSELSRVDASVAASGVKSAPSAVPQARKASLARFLEKRKERVISVSPYPVSNNSSECSNIGFGSTFATNFVTSKKQLDTVESKT